MKQKNLHYHHSKNHSKYWKNPHLGSTIPQFKIDKCRSLGLLIKNPTYQSIKKEVQKKVFKD